MMKLSFLLVAALGLISLPNFVQAAEPPAENLMADEILGDGPSEPAPALDAATPEPPPGTAPEEKTFDLRHGDAASAPETPAPEKNEAFDRLDTLKMSPAELTAFMKGGSLKSRVMKGQ